MHGLIAPRLAWNHPFEARELLVLLANNKAHMRSVLLSPAEPTSTSASAFLMPAAKAL